MVKCECCGLQSKSSKIYRLSLDDDAEEKRVCQGCFDCLMDSSKAIRMQSGQVAWEMAKDNLSTIYIGQTTAWHLTGPGA